ncbi:ATP-binding cassette domain-containing protein [Paenibacillus tyrfis]|uniref:ATP-binding cassette domain-containing protein n=1 Tax=Paenibacillus tyrfis TaxID=1501230 RepID=UPI000B590400|nr:ATP-binding cassette domain-containing protein [Paenibacillus tyrfis]
MRSKLFNIKIFENTFASFIIVAVLTIISTFLVSQYITNTQKLFDTFINATNYNNSLYVLGLFASVRIAQILLKQFQTYIEAKLQIVLSSNIQSVFFNNLNPKTITHIETPQFQNDLNTIRYGINNFTQLLLSIISAFQNAILIFIYFSILISQKWYLLLLLISYNLPKLFHEIKLTQFRMQYVENTSDTSRQREMYSEFFTRSEAQKEILIFSMKDYLFKKWSELTHLVNGLELEHKRKDIASSTLVSMVGPIGFMSVQWILLTDVFNKSISVGEYMSILTTIGMLEGSFISLVPFIGKLKNLKDMKFKFDTFFKKYLSETPLYGDYMENITSLNLIEIKKLSFKYPFNENYSLNNIDLNIKSGDVVVIVGDNGSGKSTFAKTILGLHEIQPGHIFFNNIDINRIERSSLYSCMSMVTQDYIKYPFPLLENITLNSEVNKKIDSEFITRFNYLLPKEVEETSNSLLGIDYQGSKQLSGGQWQRIAIARALYKNSSVLVLDEATSAMDPETESRLINDILEMRKKKITIIVTHRLNIVPYASKIIVMQNGKIVEHGTHTELINTKGKYFNMVSSQTNLMEEIDNGYRHVPGVI